MKKNASLFQFIAFILFVIWGVGNFINMVLGWAGVNLPAAAVVERLLMLCGLVAMIYCAYTYYSTHKTTLVQVLFWVSVIMAIIVVLFPIFGL